MPREISVVIPAYNEESNIRRTIDRTMEALRRQFERFEILIVEDASTDATAAIADGLAAEHPQVRVLHNEANLGQGGSLRRGFQNVRYEWVIHNGMDSPFDMMDLGKMIPLLDDADIVVAARLRRAGYTFYRKCLSVVTVWLLNLLFPLRLHDYSFVQLYRKDVLDAIRVGARSQGFFIPELLIRAHARGFRIKEIRIEYHAREQGVPTSGSWRVLSSSLRDLLRFWWRRDGPR